MHILLKSRMRKAFPLGGMLLSVSICSAAFDASDGYVTLEEDEYNSAANFKHSLTTAGWWSDGLAPHPDTNYYARQIGFYPRAKFEGGRLVAQFMRRYEYADWGTFASNPCEIPDLWLGVDAGDKPIITQLGVAMPIMMKGRMTVNGTLTVQAGTRGHPIQVDGSSSRTSSSAGRTRKWCSSSCRSITTRMPAAPAASSSAIRRSGMGRSR